MRTHLVLVGVCLAAVVFAATPPATAAGDGLVLHLPFDGDCAPAVGNELGALQPKNNPAFVEGRQGQAIALTNGAHLILKLPECVRTGEFTISFWLKPLWHPSDNLCHPLLEIPGDPKKTDAVGWAPDQWLLSKGFADAISPNFLYGVTDSDVACRQLKPGQWTHFLLVFSRRGQFRASYVNGEGNRMPWTATEAPGADSELMWIGQRAAGPHSGLGDFVLDDLRIYARALTSADVPLVAGAQFPPPRDWLAMGTSFDVARMVETPHVTWAKPLSRGPVRVLCVTEGRRARELAELAQCIELDPVVFTVPSTNVQLLKNPEVLQALGRNIEASLKARPSDCILLGAFGWNLLPESTRTAIVTAVRAGAGLFICAPRCVAESPKPGFVTHIGDGLWLGWAGVPECATIEQAASRLDQPDEDYLLRAIPWEANALFAGTLSSRTPASFFCGGHLDKGRILLYDVAAGTAFDAKTCLTPDRFSESGEYDMFDYDYALGAVARGLLWSAGRARAVRIQSVAFRAPISPNPRGRMGTSGEWVIDLWNSSAADVPAKVTLTARHRGPDPANTGERDLNLPPGATRVTIPQKLATVGRLYGDARVLVDGRVADWFTGTIEVEHDNPWIIALQADRPDYGDDDKPRITARFGLRKFAYRKGDAVEICWRLYDSYNRLLARGAHSAICDPSDEQINETSWTLPPLAESSLSYRLIVNLAYRDVVTDQQEIRLLRRREDNDDFMFVSWQGGGSPVDRRATLVMRDRYHLDGGGVLPRGRPLGAEFEHDLAWLAQQNLRPWIYATHIGNGSQDDNHVRAPDLANPSWQADLRARLAGVARIAASYSPLFYSLGDETQLGHPTRPSEFEQEAFHTALQARYGTLGKLNKAWGTKYNEWTDINLPLPDAEVWKTGGPIPAATQDFRDSLFAKALQIGWDGARSVEPQARVGVEGLFGLGHGLTTGQDYYKMTRHSNFLGLYALGWELNMCRSFQKPGDLLGAWYNYAKLNPEYSRYGPWHLLLHGARCFAWYITFEGAQYSALNPDFTAFEQFQWTNEELQPLLTGIGKLVVGLTRDDLGVAILHNQRNLDRVSPNYYSARMTAMLLDDLGIQHDWIHGDQIVAGDLATRKIKVLFLPGQYHMRAEVAQQIRRFVNAGGAIVADIMPAQSNGYRVYDKSPLETIFVSPSSLAGALLPANAEDLTAWNTHVKRVGHGQTLFYGGHPSAYNRDRAKTGGRLMRQVVSDFLISCGVVPQATVNAVDGSFQPRTVVTYHDGSSLYVATQRDYGVPDPSPREFEFVAPAKAHAYDVRTGKYLGETDKVKLTLEIARGALVAFLPYRAEALEIEGAANELAAGNTLRLRLRLGVTGGGPAHGVFRVETLNPAGNPVPPLCRKVRWTDGVADILLPIAFNDPVGRWTIRATDIATGMGRELRCGIKPATNEHPTPKK